MLELVNAGHHLTFQFFAQSSPLTHMAAVYRYLDWDGSLNFAKSAAGLSKRVMEKTDRISGVTAVIQRLAAAPPIVST